jgi:rhodanese-related sulfurtransferase
MKVIYRSCQLIVLLSLFSIFYGCVTSPNGDIPERKQTELGLYLTATETNDLLKNEGENILFVDVRTLAEIKKGAPTYIDTHVPIIEKRNKKRVFNKDFVVVIEDRLEDKGLNKQDKIILTCKQGHRSARATNILAQAGYKTVYSVLDGTNGWKENNLPWTDKVEEEKLYF